MVAKLLKSIFTLSLLFVFSISFAVEDNEINENPLEISARLNDSKVIHGKETKLTFYLKLDHRYHAYSEQFKLNKLVNGEKRPVKFELSPVVEFEDKLAKKTKKGIYKEAELTTKIIGDPKKGEGQKRAKYFLTYQACADDHCLFPKTVEVEVPYILASESNSKIGPTAASTANLSSMFSKQDGFSQALGRGGWFVFLFVFLAGLLTSFTPCIFPMIPITLSILGTRNTESKLKGFSLSLAYVLGISITYATLGVIAALTGGMFGAALGNPWVVSGIALIFVTMGLSMYGLFELQVPSFIRDRIGNKQTESGYIGAFTAGLIAGVVASPCVGPVLVGVLTHVAKEQDAVFGFSLLFTFAWGLGMLFLALGTFSSLLQKLPKAGGWMENVKFLFGTTMICMALYYLEPILPQKVFFGFVALTLILISSAFGAFDSNETLTTPGKMKKGVMLVVFSLGLILGLTTIIGNPSYYLNGNQVASGNSENNNEEKYSGIIWDKYSDENLASAAKAGKPVIIDFYADWCGACKELEKYTFSTREVISEGTHFVFLKVDATSETDELNELMEKYEIRGLPTVLFFNGNGELRKDLTLTAFERSEKFVERMKKARGDTLAVRAPTTAE